MSGCVHWLDQAALEEAKEQQEWALAQVVQAKEAEKEGLQAELQCAPSSLCPLRSAQPCDGPKPGSRGSDAQQRTGGPGCSALPTTSLTGESLASALRALLGSMG